MKKLFVLAVAAALLVGITAAPVLAAGQATEKATGTVGIDYGGWYASFGAHEALGDRQAKGRMKTWKGADYDSYYDIAYVNVSGTTAWFAALCTASWSPSAVGEWLFVKVTDVGTPGTMGDQIGWDWDSLNEADAENRVATTDAPNNWWNVIDGNLVVHIYD